MNPVRSRVNVTAIQPVCLRHVVSLGSDWCITANFSFVYVLNGSCGSFLSRACNVTASYGSTFHLIVKFLPQFGSRSRTAQIRKVCFRKVRFDVLSFLAPSKSCAFYANLFDFQVDLEPRNNEKT